MLHHQAASGRNLFGDVVSDGKSTDCDKSAGQLCYVSRRVVKGYGKVPPTSFAFAYGTTERLRRMITTRPLHRLRIWGPINHLSH